MITQSARVPALRFATRRLIGLLAVLLGISLLTFFIVTLLPGNTAVELLGAQASAAQIAELEAALRLDRPVWERYREWLSGILTGDFGHSLASGQPVLNLLTARLPVTLELVAFSLFLAVALSVPLAVLAARRPTGVLDRLTAVLSMAALSVPNYVLALVLVLVFSVTHPVFPSLGFVSPAESLIGNLRSLMLPATAIALPLCAFYVRFLRGDLIEQTRGQDYVLAARAKGLGPWRVLIRHALRNSLFGLLTLISLNLGALIGSTVIIEQMFALPGAGQLLLQAINLRDIVVVQAVVLVLALVTVTANLFVDILYAVLDPRVRYD